MYGMSKRFNEQFAKAYCPSATGVRLHNVYGREPRQGTLAILKAVSIYYERPKFDKKQFNN
jgi:nucleoside-diphosphate-sugar epimerase